MGCLKANNPDRCTSFLLAKNYKPTWTKTSLRLVFDMRWNKTNPDLSYFELIYVFWEHMDSVGQGTTVIGRHGILNEYSLFMDFNYTLK